jgi:hypothetical protein
MRKTFLLVVVVCSAWSGRVWGAEEASAAAQTSNPDLAARYREIRRAKNLESLRPVVARVKEQGYVSVREQAALASTIGEAIKDKVLGLTAAQRQKLVKDTLGEDDYSALVQIVTKQPSRTRS